MSAFEPLSLDDPAWATLRGGYKVLYDPRKALRALEGQSDISGVWIELWNELHHQGDVGEASYAAVPHIVRIYASRGIPDWNAYALVATIEEARHSSRNPPLPSLLEGAYMEALRKLGEIGLRELNSATEDTFVRSAIGLIAMWKNQISLGRLTDFSEEELSELLAGQTETKH